MAPTVLGTHYSDVGAAASRVVTLDTPSTPGKALLLVMKEQEQGTANLVEVGVSAGNFAGFTFLWFADGNSGRSSYFLLHAGSHKESMSQITLDFDSTDVSVAAVVLELEGDVANMWNGFSSGGDINYTTTSWTTQQLSAQRDRSVAVFIASMDNQGTLPSFDATGFDKGHTELVDTGGGGVHRMWVATAEDLDFTDEYVTMTTTDSTGLYQGEGLHIYYDINPPTDVVNREMIRSLDDSSTSKTMPWSFTPTAGNELVVVAQAAATFTTPTGWTRVSVEYLADYAFVAFTKTSDGTETGISWTQNGARVAAGVVWELPAGSVVGDSLSDLSLESYPAQLTSPIGPYAERRVWLFGLTTGNSILLTGPAGDVTFASAFAEPTIEPESAGVSAGDVTIPAGETRDAAWIQDESQNYRAFRFAVTVPDPSGPFSPLDIDWAHAFWAEDPGFIAPADGEPLPSAPTNHGTLAAAATPSNVWGRVVSAVDGPTWVADSFASRPAIRSLGLRGLEISANAGLLAADTTRTVVVVGKTLGTDSDLFDAGPARMLLDRSGTDWRVFAGATGGLPVTSGADADVHLFIAELAGASSSLQIDAAVYGPFDAGSFSEGSSSVRLGYSPSGDGNVSGSEVYFGGVIARALTTQEKNDLFSWFTDLSAVFPPPGGLTARGDGDGIIDISWQTVPNASGYRVYIDGFQEGGTITETSLRKTGLVPGQEYAITVSAIESGTGTESAQTDPVYERAARVFTSVDAEVYTGYDHTPLVDTASGGQKAINWHDYSAFYSNARSTGAHFSWYLEGTDTPLYGYAHEWLDGATIAWRSGGPCRIIEWNLGDDAWRETDVAAPGDTHTIDNSDITTNAGGGSVTAARFNNNLLEHAVQFQDNFEVWIWGASEPAAPSTPGPVTLTTTWRGVESDSANATSYTFSAVDIGTDSDVLVLAWLRSLDDLTGSSITVDGQTGTVVFARAVEDVGGGAWNWIVGVHVSGLTGPVDIVVTAGPGATALRGAAAVWSVDGDPGVVSGDNVHADEQPGFVTDQGALLAAAYTGQSTTEFVKSNAEGLTTRAQVEVEPTNNIFNVADDLTDTGLTYLRWPQTEPPTSWGWTAWLTFSNREAVPDSIPVENAKAGDTTSIELPVGNGVVGYLGYSKQYSVDAGETIDFAVDGTDATDLDIYRIGYYGGDGKRLITSISNTPTDQAAGSVVPDSNGGTEMAWTTTASWAVPADTTSGMFVAVVKATNGSAQAWIPFVVRNDSRVADVVVMTSDATWGAAYNHFGDVGTEKTGKSVYGAGGALGNIADRCHYVSYNRPIVTRGTVVNHWDAQELALIDWMEENGYDVKYIGSYDLDQNRGISGATTFISVGHDEYYSQGMRDNLEAFRDAGGNVVFMAGNHVFWRIRWAPDGRGFWCYKDTMPGPGGHVAGEPLDPVSWTGTWKDTRRPDPPGPEHEYTTTGDSFRMNGINNLTMTVVAATYGSLPFWRNTSVQDGPTDLVVAEVIGFEANQYMPPDSGAIRLAQTTHDISGSVAGPNGQNYSGSGDIDWSPVMFYANATAGITVSFGSTQWQWGLSDRHERGSQAVANVQMRQATANLLADLGVSPATIQPDLVDPTPVALSTYGVTYTGEDPQESPPPSDGSIFYPADQPGMTAASDGSDLALLTRFTVDGPGTVQRIWYWKAWTGDQSVVTAFLLDASNETVLGQTTVDWGTETGWVSVDLPSPVAVAAGTVYGAGLLMPGADQFSVELGRLSTDVVNGSITAVAPCTYKYTSTVDTTGYSDASDGRYYGIDIAFVADGAGGDQKMSVGGLTVVRAFDGTTEAARVYSGGVLLLGTAP